AEIAALAAIIEGDEALHVDGLALRVQHEEADVDVAPGLVGVMPGERAAGPAGEVADEQGGVLVLLRHAAGGELDQVDQRGQAPRVRVLALAEGARSLEEDGARTRTR